MVRESQQVQSVTVLPLPSLFDASPSYPRSILPKDPCITLGLLRPGINTSAVLTVRTILHHLRTDDAVSKSNSLCRLPRAEVFLFTLKAFLPVPILSSFPSVVGAITCILYYTQLDTMERGRSRSSTPPTPPPLSPSILPESEVPEVSMVEAEDVTGVTFTPE